MVTYKIQQLFLRHLESFISFSIGGIRNNRNIAFNFMENPHCTKYLKIRKLLPTINFYPIYPWKALNSSHDSTW